MRKTPRLIPILVTLILAACGAPGPSPPAIPALPHDAAPAEVAPHEGVLVFLRSGEAAADMSTEQRGAVQMAHMANINRLAQAGQIVLAGPMGRENPDPSLRGLFLFDVAGVAQAEELTRTDPAVAADVLRLEAHALVHTADLRALNARDLADAATREAEGRPFLEGMQNYVLVLAHDAARAGPHLDGHAATCLATRLRGDWSGRAFFILDAPDLAAARALLEPLGDLGTVELYPWFGSANVARMREP